LHQFEEAKNFGSLIQPCLTEAEVQNVRLQIQNSESKIQNSSGQLFLRETHLKVLRVLEQAEELTQRYHVVVANPPYLGGRQMSDSLRTFAIDNYEDSKSDLFAMFTERGFSLAQPTGYNSLITMQSWMFLSSFEALRKSLITQKTFVTMAHLGAHAFDTIGGEIVQTTAFVAKNVAEPRVCGSFIRLTEGGNETEKAKLCLEAIENPGCGYFFRASVADFKKIPGGAFAYWLSKRGVAIFQDSPPLKAALRPKQGTSTGDDERFVRFWQEVNYETIGFGIESLDAARKSQRRYFPLDKGGSFRKWYGNNEKLLRFDEPNYTNLLNMGNHLPSRDLYFKRGLTWSKIASLQLSVRYDDYGFIFSSVGLKGFPEEKDCYVVLGYMNSRLALMFTEVLSPTLSIISGDIEKLPFRTPGSLQHDETDSRVRVLVAMARADWDNFETSWDFRDPPLLRPGLKGATLEASWRNWEAQSSAAIRRMQELETENNRLFIAAYGLEGELQPEVPEAQITLARAEARRDMAAFLSYAVGCMMGRFSLDAPGLILANAGDTVEDYLRVVTAKTVIRDQSSVIREEKIGFAPDADGIIPVLDGEWFEDDIVVRAKEFLRATFGEATLAENIAFIEASLGKELRTYFLNDFYKDHLQTYKNRPIYWQISSGKQKAFQCLVYLHRYTPATLARIRTEYAIPLQGKLSARITRLEEETGKATASTTRKKLQTDLDKSKKQMVELLAFDEQLRSYADQAITLDLDDGVKTNYAKFGPLLAEAKKVCGTKED
jgi:Eco57I restriction-modification methylase